MVTLIDLYIEEAVRNDSFFIGNEVEFKGK